MESDPHAGPDGRYTIRSLYFDNYQDKVLREKIDGLNNREKFRIRYYNGDAAVIHLEKKSKMRGLCNKVSTSITKEQVENILTGNIGFLLEEKKNLFAELYAKMTYQCIRPRVIVDYQREPYIYRPGNVRITFDTNIRTGLYGKEFFDWDCPTVETVQPGEILMEVKYDEFMPEIIASCIQVNERPGHAFSKYAVCRKYG